MVTIAPYGTWVSPLAAQDVAGAGGSIQWVDQHDGETWWAESRPEEGGRVVLMRAGKPGEQPRQVLAAPWNARNRVHEYGGKPWAFVGGRIAFTHWNDQRVYLVDGDDPAAEPRPISPEPPHEHWYRYTDLTASPDGAEVWCVRETQLSAANVDVRRDLVALPLDGTQQARVLVASHHFMSAPQPSPDGRHVAWLGWNHPAMPWDGTELCVAELTEDGKVGEHRVIAGGPAEAVCQFRWESPETLLALTDPQGWWNLHRITLDGTATNLAPCEEELGGPLWRLGSSWFAPLGNGRHAVIRGTALAVLDERSGTVTDVETDLPVWLGQISAADGVVVGIAGGPRDEEAVVRLDLSTGEASVLTVGEPLPLDPVYLPTPYEQVFTSPDGEKIPAFVYPPTNPDFVAPEGELPPYVVHVHGGPTGSVSGTLSLTVTYFTSRGIGVVAVNYGGSTGYGRRFRERLNGQWGVVDVQDCGAVATALADEGIADRARLAIRGGSAGGFTTAAALTMPSPFACGNAMYPAVDMIAFASGETHDFESRYLDGLIGPLDTAREVYLERSPSERPDKLTGPILLLQGLEDEVCPPAHTEAFARAIDGSGIRHAYLGFAGEQHGFRRAETIKAALEAELSFYGQVLGFEPVDVPRLALHT
ncbi:prolyl oligopeptidase family serine peptidase [Kutzneria buriramensis]|uniref:Dipeptidyl aminopeptidase/acylaminoacyl peptidase n=1 Tax=Kutzneria buriramensis TaxID=1045776 RepID=A0A3E0HLB9_9PSEU|nr:prolyl oligopeptidase family serine peptidase [Kutzneria buriramensis]REH47178.1 dipeptidyl aminopeptidase/acylaminoacyl peptidase [Kutzneria buriramensis]